MHDTRRTIATRFPHCARKPPTGRDGRWRGATWLLPLALAWGMATPLAGCRGERAADDAGGTTPVPAPATPPPAAPHDSPAATPATPATPADTIPDAFRGRWASDATACSATGHEAALHTTADRISFHESSGPVLTVATREDTMTVTARLTGEGETRDVTYRFRLSGDGATLKDLASGLTRTRCR